MLFGMTRGEIGLVLFIFALIYAVRLLPRAGDLIGRLFGDGPGHGRGDKGSGA